MSTCKRLCQNTVQIVVLLVPLLLASEAGHTQPYTVFNYTAADVLPSSEVYDIYADRRGFLWFATDNGVVRYDGREFASFHVRDGLSDPVVFGFFEDSRGYVWFRTFSGRLSYFDGRQILPYRYNEQLIRDREYGFLNFVYDAPAGDLWFTLAHHFGKIDPDGEVHHYPVRRPSYMIKSIAGERLQGNDLKYAVKELIIDDKAFPIQLSDTTERKFFNSVECGGRLYVSVYKDVFEYDYKQVRRILTSDVPVISLSKDRDDNLWIGYLNRGVERFTEKGRWAPSFLKDKSVTRVFQDPTSGFWFSTLESSVYFVPDFHIRNLSLPASSRLQAVLAVGDTVLAGDQTGNLFFLDATNGQLLGRKKFDGEVYALFRDSGGRIWISAGFNTFRYDAAFRRLDLYPQLVATTFDEGPNHSVWAYGGIRLTCFDSAGNMLQSTARYNNYRTMRIHDSLIYFAGRTGLHVRNKQMELLETPPQLASFKITQFESINDTTLALATQGNGLFFVNPRTWRGKQFDMRHQFIANNIYRLARTDSMLWAATERGLVALNVTSMPGETAHFIQLKNQSGFSPVIVIPSFHGAILTPTKAGHRST